MASMGNWKYGSDVTANYQDDNSQVITNPIWRSIYRKIIS